MAKRRKKVQLSDVSSLAAPLLLSGERVQSWRQERANRLDVFVMDHDPEDKAGTDEYTLCCGGRELQFAYKGGRWVFVGEGVWRSCRDTA